MPGLGTPGLGTPRLRLALRLLFWLAGWKTWAAMSWAELERDCEARCGGKSKSEVRESTEERAREVPDRPRWWVLREVLVEVFVRPRSRPEMEAALSSKGRFFLRRFPMAPTMLSNKRLSTIRRRTV